MTASTPRDRMGIYGTLEDVPEGRRFHQFASAYEGRDAWSEYRETVRLSDRMSEEWERFSRRWKEHIVARGRHHALAQPGDVEAWSKILVDRFSIDRTYQHWNVIEGFYDWLKCHTEHPHSYNPFHMAASEPESTAHRIWNYKMKKRND